MGKFAFESPIFNGTKDRYEGKGISDFSRFSFFSHVYIYFLMRNYKC